MHKLVVAWKFVNAEQKAKEAHSGLEGVNEELENVKQQIVGKLKLFICTEENHQYTIYS